jgi:hypothetical protein
MTEPTARRPYMPGYGIVGPEEGGGLLPWSWALERLHASHDYWMATVWPDGRPHVMPVWGVWAEDALWFSSGGQSRKARNLAGNPHAVATTDNPLDPVIVEGVVDFITSPEGIGAFTVAVNEKYRTDYTVEFFSDNACLRLTPTSVFALSEADFTGSPTRWTFPEA